jgi:photosystem II stability/assembly factor-like uncharacterized protein
MRCAMHRGGPIAGLAIAAALASCGGDRIEPAASASARPPPAVRPRLTAQRSGTANRLQAVSPVDRRVVWASGLGGTYAVTVDGGTTWRAGVVPGGERLEFRDVEGVSESVAYLLASGTGASSRIYKTEDGGATWTLQFQNPDPKGFSDCFAFWTPQGGIAMADSLAGRFPVLRTRDGRTWQDIGAVLPPAQPGESAFAASGTCVATHGAGRAWIVTGGAARARVLATSDGGETWRAHEVPIGRGGEGSGIFSIAFRDGRRGVLAGGDLAAPRARQSNFARTRDGGATWQPAAPAPLAGPVFGLAYARSGAIVVATGPGGAAWTGDEGASWSRLDGVSDYWAVAFSGRSGWLVGTGGRILRLDL